MSTLKKKLILFSYLSGLFLCKSRTNKSKDEKSSFFIFSHLDVYISHNMLTRYKTIQCLRADQMNTFCKTTDDTGYAFSTFYKCVRQIQASADSSECYSISNI